MKLRNGKRINTIGDAWVTGGMLDFKRNTPPEIQANMQKVEQILDLNKRNWNQEIIWRHFSSNDAHRILQTHIPQSPMEDEIFWEPRTTGKYSVKSGYAFLINKSKDHTVNIYTSRIWKNLWIINTLQKWKVFIWKMCNNALATKTNINAEGSLWTLFVSFVERKMRLWLTCSNDKGITMINPFLVVL